MSIATNGISQEFTMIAQLYDTSAKLLGEAIQMGNHPTKTGSTRIRKLLNEAGANVKLARKDFKEFTMEKFGVAEDPKRVESAKKTARCTKCGLFLPRDQSESNVLVCEKCGSEPFEAMEETDAPAGGFAPQE
jgi:Zn finger protein HypA/HybF involved in hydrogenase expression